MKWYRSADGEPRIWYSETEIEHIAEDELARGRLTPRATTPVTDLEAFIESHLDADLDQYADLPGDVLGLTRFEPGSRPVVLINAELTSAADEAAPGTGARGRFRATTAHEAAHVFLHRYLFDPVLEQPALFETPTGGGQRPPDGLMRCLARDVGMTARSDWREVQANRGMAALLMPRAVFRRVAFGVIGAEVVNQYTGYRSGISALGNLSASSFSTGARIVIAVIGALLTLVALRQCCLDELERRDPTALQDWLTSGARASSSPERFLKPPHDSGSADAA
jgi:uncharacterized membrane protein YeaQ/YmgE (transglycosylase-associated protein family)